MDKSNDISSYHFGALDIAKELNTTPDIIRSLAAMGLVDCIYFVGIPLFDRAGVEKIKLLLQPK